MVGLVRLQTRGERGLIVAAIDSFVAGAKSLDIGVGQELAMVAENTAAG
jgi:hypothetical protein